MSKYKDLGKLHVLCFDKTATNRRRRIKCQCQCGNIYYTDKSSLSSGHIKSCGCDNTYKLLSGKNKHNWKGYEDISQSFFCRYIHSAKKRNLEMHITIQDIWKLYIQQNRL